MPTCLKKLLIALFCFDIFPRSVYSWRFCLSVISTPTWKQQLGVRGPLEKADRKVNPKAKGGCEEKMAAEGERWRSAVTANSKLQEARNEKILKRLLRLPENKRCPNCESVVSGVYWVSFGRLRGTRSPYFSPCPGCPCHHAYLVESRLPGLCPGSPVCRHELLHLRLHHLQWRSVSFPPFAVCLGSHFSPCPAA
jgi:hypothetical protein